jgi:hypothetical protein
LILLLRYFFKLKVSTHPNLKECEDAILLGLCGCFPTVNF